MKDLLPVQHKTICSLGVETLFTLKKKCLIKPKHDLQGDCSASLNESYKILISRGQDQLHKSHKEIY